MIAFPQFELQFIRASHLIPKFLGRVGRDYENEVECSVVTLCIFNRVRRARVIKNKNRGGFIDRQRKGLGIGEGENSSLFFFLAR